MKKILCILMLILSHDLSAVIVFLDGLADKSTLCKEVADTPEWEVVSTDEVWIDGCLELCETMFPEEYTVVRETIARENIFHAINRDQVIFNATTTAEQRTRAEVALYTMRRQLDSEDIANKARHSKWYHKLQDLTLQRIVTAAEQGKNVLADDWILDKNHLEIIKKEHTTKQLLLFCSLQTAVNHAIAQNTQAVLNQNLSSHRLTYLRPSLFHSIYELKPESSEKTLGEITRSQAANVLDLIKLVLPVRDDSVGGWYNLWSRGELSKSDLHRHSLTFLKAFKGEEVHYIEPRNEYDLIINADSITPKEVALKMFAMLSADH